MCPRAWLRISGNRLYGVRVFIRYGQVEACWGQQIRSHGLIPEGHAGQRHVFWVIVANSNKIAGRIQSSNISNIFKIQKNNPVFSLCQNSHLLLSSPVFAPFLSSQGHFLTMKREHNNAQLHYRAGDEGGENGGRRVNWGTGEWVHTQDASWPVGWLVAQGVKLSHSCV